MRTGIIPAGGLSSRYNAEYPKWAETIDGEQLLMLQINKITPFVDVVIVIIREEFIRYLNLERLISSNVKVVIVPPTTSPYHTLKEFRSIYRKKIEDCIVLWSDQIGVTLELIRNTLKYSGKKSVIPGFFERSPYVYYDIQEESVVKSYQTIQGDKPTSIGFRDVGLFYFKEGDFIKGLEMNSSSFLEMLCELRMKPINIAKTEHSIGLNSKSDLAEYNYIKLLGVE